MSTEFSLESNDAALVAKLDAAQRERAAARRQLIEQQLSAGVLSDEHVQVGLTAFHGICDQWAIDATDAMAILYSKASLQTSLDTVDLLERISYLLRIYRLADDVIQGDCARIQRWIRRANPALDGHRPIDLITAGPVGSAQVMEYLVSCKIGTSH